MHTYPDCHLCILNQALTAARRAGGSEAQQQEVLCRVHRLLAGADPGAVSPSALAEFSNRIAGEVTGQPDPYRAEREAHTAEALALFPHLKALVADAVYPLEAALRVSIAGNIIDVVNAQEYDLWAVVERVMAQPLAADGRAAFRRALGNADWVLYLGDNAGEAVFDRVLIEALPVPVIYAYKGSPILNDVTLADAQAAGLDGVARLVSNGSAAPGTVLERCSPDFVDLYRQARLIIAKGQANYETLDKSDPRLFLLFQVKCPIIGQDAGLPVGGIALLNADGTISHG